MEVELNLYTYSLLASLPSAIRQKKESAIYRNPATPHGTPLKTGLALPGERSWQTRDGDLRHVWNAYAENGPGKVLSLKGLQVTEVPVEKITRWIHILGSHLSQTSPTKRIALHLPNDIENLVASFACHFYGLALILLPYPSDSKTITSILTKTQADLAITAAGVIPLNDLQSVPSLENILYVVEPASRDLDWATPQDAIPTISPPRTLTSTKPAIITAFTPLSTGKLEVTEFSTRNLIAAIGAQLASLPPPSASPRKIPSSPRLPLPPLPAHANGALAQPHQLLPIAHARLGAHPKRQLAYPRQRLHAPCPRKPALPPPRITHELALAKDTQPLNSYDLNDLRQFLAARVVYALCSPRVAGAICAQNALDYRCEKPERLPSRKLGVGRKCTHFGPPLGGAEVWVREVEGYKVEEGEGGDLG
ncbi:hypothetical protein BGX38DRAFT_1270916 [Terfezia claveryi]|nr:hypothetical protein BGX38DRAFT_1280221 [Terfezia claveryi]KAF8446759.1 hypothetical protein BGX38DRAFT_1270916 [Terfezia claveryi]